MGEIKMMYSKNEIITKISTDIGKIEEFYQKKW